jgi:hypothetical protein
MMKQAHQLFDSSAACPTLLPPKDARHGAKASSSPPQRCPKSRDLCHTAPELFAELVNHYGALLDEAVEQRVHPGESLSAELDDLSARLKRFQAGARDIIELHARTLDGKLASASSLMRGAYVEEGRLVLLELMGRLLSAYRTAYLQATQSSGTTS